MTYEEVKFKIPSETDDYRECSEHVIRQIELIVDDAIKAGENKIVINTNLRLGLPMENINKIAGPFVEAWAFETFSIAMENPDNKYQLINVQAQMNSVAQNHTWQARAKQVVKDLTQ